MLFNLGRLDGDHKGFLIFVIAYLIVIILSLSLHEYSHALSAYKNGDSTPKATGRLTLNPFNHIDPIGMVCCALLGFGWARPVQINPSNFRNVKRGIVWTSISGVLMNLFLAFIGYGLYMLVLKINTINVFVEFLVVLFYYMFFINLSLAVFNFLPIYPLDGFKFVEAVTKYNNSYVKFMYKYGNILLIVLLIFFDALLINLISLVSYPITWFWNLIL